MMLEFSVDPDLTEALRDEILDCWTDATLAGGAIGFVPPVTKDEIAPTAERDFAGVADGRDRLVVGRIAGRLAAVAFIVDERHGLSRHWRTVKRVMVHPDFQGSGHGLELMDEVARIGRTMDLEMLSLDCRSGAGLDRFYKRCGYLEWGRFPRALRIAADDFRDIISFYLPL
jgi:GNAT superfamily N-acetyltransferase